MAGLEAYRDVVYGPDHTPRAEDRIATIQSFGGSGALRVGADFSKKNFRSVSKNFSMYGERVGSLSIVCASKPKPTA